MATVSMQFELNEMTAATVDIARTSAIRTVGIERYGLDALQEALNGELGVAFAQAGALLRATRGNVIVTGMGKSGHIGRKIAATFSSTGTPCHFVHPAEASHGDLGMIRDVDVVLALSWSGETPELSDVVAHTRRFGMPLIAITSRQDSALGTAADVMLCLPVAQEACPNGVAPTTSTTMQLAIGDAMAVYLLEARGFTAADFQTFHPGGKLGARLARVDKLMHTQDELPLVPVSASLAETIVEMTSKHFGIAGVVDVNGDLIGVVTDGDLRRAFKAGFVNQSVKDAMTTSPFTVSPNTLAALVLAHINRARITAIFVTEGKRPVGLIHIHDLLRAGIV